MTGRRSGIRTSFVEIRTKLPGARARIRRAAPFASGVVAALLAVWLFTVMNPAPAPLTSTDIKTTVDQTLASQTPGPAVSSLVYAAAQPSLVLIETQGERSASNG